MHDRLLGDNHRRQDPGEVRFGLVDTRLRFRRPNDARSKNLSLARMFIYLSVGPARLVF